MNVTDADELRRFAAQFTRTLVPHEKEAVVVTLSGELGAGKTTFAQASAQALGVDERVTSPTFVIEKIYRLNGRRFARLIHFDAYRLESPHELEMLGWRELVADPGNLMLLEWPEKVAELIPASAIRIRFDIQGDGRTISLNGKEDF